MLLRNRNFYAQENNFHNSQKHSFDLILFELDWYTNFLGCPNLVGFLELHKYSRVTDYYRLIAEAYVDNSIRVRVVPLVPGGSNPSHR